MNTKNVNDFPQKNKSESSDGSFPNFNSIQDISQDITSDTVGFSKLYHHNKNTSLKPFSRNESHENSRKNTLYNSDLSEENFSYSKSRKTLISDENNPTRSNGISSEAQNNNTESKKCKLNDPLLDAISNIYTNSPFRNKTVDIKSYKLAFGLLLEKISLAKSFKDYLEIQSLILYLQKKPYICQAFSYFLCLDKSARIYFERNFAYVSVDYLDILSLQCSHVGLHHIKSFFSDKASTKYSIDVSSVSLPDNESTKLSNETLNESNTLKLSDSDIKDLFSFTKIPYYKSTSSLYRDYILESSKYGVLPTRHWSSASFIFLITHLMAETNVDFSIWLSCQENFSFLFSRTIIEAMALNAAFYFIDKFRENRYSRNESYVTTFNQSKVSDITQLSSGVSVSRDMMNNILTNESSSTDLKHVSFQNQICNTQLQPIDNTSKLDSQCIPDDTEPKQHITKPKRCETDSLADIDRKSLHYVNNGNATYEFNTREFPTITEFAYTGNDSSHKDNYVYTAYSQPLSNMGNCPKESNKIVEFTSENLSSRSLPNITDTKLFVKYTKHNKHNNWLNIQKLEKLVDGDSTHKNKELPKVNEINVGHCKSSTKIENDAPRDSKTSSRKSILSSLKNALSSRKKSRTNKQSQISNDISGIIHPEKNVKGLNANNIVFKTRLDVMQNFPIAMNCFIFGHIFSDIVRVPDINTKLLLILEYYASAEECQTFIESSILFLHCIQQSNSLFDVISNSFPITSAVLRVLERLLSVSFSNQNNTNKYDNQIYYKNINNFFLNYRSCFDFCIRKKMKKFFFQKILSSQLVVESNGNSFDKKVNKFITGGFNEIKRSRTYHYINVADEVSNLCNTLLPKLACSCRYHDFHVSDRNMRPSHFGIHIENFITGYKSGRHNLVRGLISTCNFPAIIALRNANSEMISMICKVNFEESNEHLFESLLILENIGLYNCTTQIPSIRIMHNYEFFSCCLYCGQRYFTESTKQLRKKDFAMLVCKNCQMARYCSIECQKNDSNFHMHFCDELCLLIK